MSNKLKSLIQENVQIVKARQELQERVKKIQQCLQDYLSFHYQYRDYFDYYLKEPNEDSILYGYHQELKQLQEQIEILMLKQQEILNEMERETCLL